MENMKSRKTMTVSLAATTMMLRMAGTDAADDAEVLMTRRR